MSVRTLLFRRNISRNIRTQAWLNVACAVYMWTMTLSVTQLTFFLIIPECYEGNDGLIFSHRLFVWYIFSSVIGNYVTCIATDTKPKVRSKKIKALKVQKTTDTMEVSNGSKDESSAAETKNKSAVISKYPTKSKNAQSSGTSEVTQRNKQKSSVVKTDGKTKDLKIEQASGSSEVNQKNQSVSSVVHTKGRYCLPCDNHVPPRAHHCFLCEKCVLRRDHHCFFMGVCIGQTNHIYFILFTLYMGIGTFYGMLMVAKYMHFQYSIQFYGPQTFITLFLGTIFSLLQGHIPTLLFLTCFVFLYVSLAGSLFAFGFFFWHIMITSRGQTTFEARRGHKQFSEKSIIANMKQVLNKNLILSTFIPFWDYTMNVN